MMSPLRFLLINQLKRPKQTQKTGGFTLLELLVGLILAFVVITPLLGFMISIMQNDRQEQAKAQTEQELRAAVDYITQDLQQAVYIYDSLTIASQLPPRQPSLAGCANNPPNDICTPVLAFWKRDLRKNAIPAINTPPVDCGDEPNKCDDGYVYSLVSYYLISGNNPDKTWSNVARIARFEVSGGIARATEDNVKFPAPGFNRFRLDGPGRLQDKMDSWTKGAGTYGVNFGSTVLVDYIDLPNPDLPTPPSAIICDTANPDPTKREQQVPPATTGINSFYACVNSNPGKNYARVYIRGNALARIQKTNNDYNATQSSFFPTATIQVQGSGSLYNKQ